MLRSKDRWLIFLALPALQAAREGDDRQYVEQDHRHRQVQRGERNAFAAVGGHGVGQADDGGIGAETALYEHPALTRLFHQPLGGQLQEQEGRQRADRAKQHQRQGCRAAAGGWWRC